jgi:hypothetical protein
MFISQYTIEQRQENCWIDNNLANSSTTNSMCAWCLSERGIAAGEGSHGICKKHADSFLIQWRKHRDRHMAMRT